MSASGFSFGSTTTQNIGIQPGTSVGNSTGGNFVLPSNANTVNTGQPAGFTFGTHGTQPVPSVSLPITITTYSTPIVGGTGIFANVGNIPVDRRGLGGVDPKTTNSGVNSTIIIGKSVDSKAVKESQTPNEISASVKKFKIYVKEQKSVRENIARLSSKPMFRVQEEVASLKQLLALVSNGLHRNAVSIEKLKKESAQELKHAEMAHRTKDTPGGLQYENTTPTEYFHSLVEDFEYRMVMYRQQIEDTENHLSSFGTASALSPQELAKLLNKLHESFVALAAQLQAVHECVQGQKEQFMNYRKVFHSDTTDIFERRKRAQEKTGSGIIVTAGPTPFTEMSSAAATAMASALNRTQPAAGQAQLMGQTTLMAGGLGTGAGFGTQQTTGTGSVFGATALGGGTGGLFGGPPTQSNAGLFAKPVGFGPAILPATTNSTGFSFSTPLATVKPLGAPQPTAGFGGFGTQGTGFSSTGFQLSNPPLGNKRGKKA